MFTNCPFIKVFTFVFILCFVSLNAQKEINTEIKYLSGQGRLDQVKWEFYCSEGRKSGNWTTINVPSNWELEGFGTYNYGHDAKYTTKPIGKEFGLYKHRFEASENWKGKEINLVFEGSMTDTEVKINGKLVGPIHQGSFYRFKYNITPFLRFGKSNILEIKVSKVSSNESVNAAERDADYWVFGGIFRPVYLEILPKVHLTRASLVSKADGTFEARVFVNQPAINQSVEIELLDQSGAQIGKTIHKAISADDKFTFLESKYEVESWNPESPVLYQVKVKLLSDGVLIHTISEKTGFRTVEFVENDGLYVNGKRIILKGVNRHSFWPTSGRCLAEIDHFNDIQLIKDMNMNAVRMSHYPPDAKFLDFCDSMGLFVLDELGGWQAPYDTVVGPKLIKEMVYRDENHPSIVAWDLGNEGGWEFANEKWFHQSDFQNRKVFYPWLKRNGVDTRHYPSYQTLQSRFLSGNVPFFPTELLHGLYDGGLGAGLEDYWKAASANALNAGGFMWNLRDEAVWRTDSLFYDSSGNRGPDGIVGPNGEKEGSFYTIKEIWSPVQIPAFNVHGLSTDRIKVENQFLYTNLEDCQFQWQLIQWISDEDEKEAVFAERSFQGPHVEPGTSAFLNLGLPSDYNKADVLKLSVQDPFGRQVMTWQWPLHTARYYTRKNSEEAQAITENILAEESNNKLHLTVGHLVFEFDLANAFLTSVMSNGKKIPFGNGPKPVGINSDVESVAWEKDKSGNVEIMVSYETFPKWIKWKINKSGFLKLEVAPVTQNFDDIEMLGVTFSFPEEQIKSVEWKGKGPYRVYKNRQKGPTFGLWKKDYNNTITGQSFDDLKYPEFKGYYADLYWAKLIGEENKFEVLCASDKVYLHLFTPQAPAAPGKGAHTSYPQGDISLLYTIPAIGTKFLESRELGPTAVKDQYKVRSQDVFEPMEIWFDFRNQK